MAVGLSSAATRLLLLILIPLITNPKRPPPSIFPQIYPFPAYQKTSEHIHSSNSHISLLLAFCPSVSDPFKVLPTLLCWLLSSVSGALFDPISENVFSLLRLSAPVRLLLVSRSVFLLLSETNCKGSKQEQSAMKMEQNSLAARRKFLGDPFSLTIMPTMDLIGDENGQRGIPVDNCRRHPRPSVLFPVRILPHLYLGNDETAKNLNTLKRSNIRYVINVTPNLPNYFAGEPDFHYLRIPVDDSCSPNLAQFFPEAISFIEKAREEHSSVLVHCWAGISRSVTVCLAYLMYALHSTLEDAFDLLLKQNGTIAPNFHFMETLTCWERQLFDRTAGFSSASTSTATSSASSSTVSSASAICSPPESTFSIGSQEMLAHGEPRPDGSEWTCPSSPNERPSSATSPKSENFTSKRALHASESSPPADSSFIRK